MSLLSDWQSRECSENCSCEIETWPLDRQRVLHCVHPPEPSGKLLRLSGPVPSNQNSTFSELSPSLRAAERALVAVGSGLIVTISVHKMHPSDHRRDREVGVPSFPFVTSLDRKRLGKTLRVGMGNRSEAFSIRRLGVSRLRLRGARCVMGVNGGLGRNGSVGRHCRS